MAIPSNQRFTKAIVGQMMAGADVNIYATNTTAAYPIGQGCMGAAGEVYRYASFDAFLLPNQIVGPSVANTLKTIQTTVGVATASIVNVQAEYPIIPNSIGSHYVQVTLSGITANQYQGGKLVIAAKSGQGYTYDIKGNTATGNPASGNLNFQLVQPLQAGVSPNTSIIIVPSKYNDLVACKAGSGNNYIPSGIVMGSPGNNSGATNLFGWIQTKGVCGCLEDDTSVIVAGQPITLSGVTAGAYAIYGNVVATTFTTNGAVGTCPPIGYCISPNGTSNGYGAVNIDLE